MNTESNKVIRYFNTYMDKSWMENIPDPFYYMYYSILPKLRELVDEGISVHPIDARLVKCFKATTFDNIKVVIIGMDPYPKSEDCVGLSFDNYQYKSFKSPSLRAIVNKIMIETGDFAGKDNKESVLEHLPSQGVLLLNAALTLETGKSGSHGGLWAPFTDKLVEHLMVKDNIVWILWGNDAKAFAPKITNPTHLTIKGTHPSPLARNAEVKFESQAYFTSTNEYLTNKGISPINW